MKAKTLRDAAQYGVTEAARMNDVPVGTASSWISRATTDAVSLTGIVVNADEPWSERRPKLAQAFAVAAHEAVVAAQAAVAAGKARDSRDLSVSAGILVDKAALMNGMATSRSESFVATARVEQGPPEHVVRLREDVERMKEELRALGEDPDEDIE